MTVTPVADRANDDSLFFRDESVDIITLSERNCFLYQFHLVKLVIFKVAHISPELDMDWIHPWIGLDWVR